MKNNSKKHGGFTLIEVVICIAILSIISIGLYDGFMIIMKQIKAGQVKQAAALEGKKIIETMKATNFDIPNSTNNYEIDLGNNIIFEEKKGSNGQIEKDVNGNIIYARTSGNYIEKVTLTPTKAYNISPTTQQSVELDTNGTLNSQSNKLYISKISSQDYIAYWGYSLNKYIPTTSNSTKIQSNSQSNLQISIYFTTDNGNQIIDIKDYTGQEVFNTPITNTGKDLVINFSNYVNADGSVPANDTIELDIYNKTTADTPKIYIEKPEELNVDIEARKGEINIYDNRSENPQEDNVGTLYDIQLQINDNNNNNLFTGYYKKNIH